MTTRTIASSGLWRSAMAATGTPASTPQSTVGSDRISEGSSVRLPTPGGMGWNATSTGKIPGPTVLSIGFQGIQASGRTNGSNKPIKPTSMPPYLGRGTRLTPTLSTLLIIMMLVKFFLMV
ncbi:hypothetical protein TMEN_6615 [Trichophyton mentagrophytes]|nr:hypothetical protein TMEN_6615 [Trichophyton mentagrophytes]